MTRAWLVLLGGCLYVSTSGDPPDPPVVGEWLECTVVHICDHERVEVPGEDGCATSFADREDALARACAEQELAAGRSCLCAATCTGTRVACLTGRATVRPMANNVIAQVTDIIANPTDLRCSGEVLPQGGGNPVLWTAVFNYGDTLNSMATTARAAIVAAMATAGYTVGVSDKIALFGGPQIL